MAPIVDLSSANLANNATFIVITGTGFDTTAANNTVIFNNGAIGTVTGATATSLTVTFTTQPTSNGNLTAVVTSNGNSSGSATQVGTVVAADTTAPTLASSTPADNATAIAFDSNIVLNFSETVVAGTGNIVIKNASGTAVATIPVADAQVSISGSTVTINPTADLDYSTGYYVEIASGVFKDTANNDYTGISGSSTLNFNTVAAPASPYSVSIPDLLAASDDGASNDNITSIQTPTFIGVGPVSTTIELINQANNVIGTTTSDGSGNWTITSSTLSSGSYSIKARYFSTTYSLTQLTGTAGNANIPSAITIAPGDQLYSPAAPGVGYYLDLPSVISSGNSLTNTWSDLVEAYDTARRLAPYSWGRAAADGFEITLTGPSYRGNNITYVVLEGLLGPPPFYQADAQLGLENWMIALTNDPDGVAFENDSQGSFFTTTPPSITSSYLLSSSALNISIIPTITSATYDAITGVLSVTGTNFAATGGSDDIDVSKLTITAEGGATRTLSSSNVEITSATAFSVTLNGTDKAALNQIVNKDGTVSTGGTTYNIAAASNWNPANTGAADLTGNGITVSNVAVPTITSASYDTTGTLVVTGTGFLKLTGATNDIDISKFTITGQGGSTYILTTSNVEITSGTSFSVTLNSADQTGLSSLLNKSGSSSIGATTYNIAALEDWAAGANAAVAVADLTDNGIAVAAPTVTSSTANLANNATSIVITGTGFNTTASNNTVVFNNGAIGTVASATATQLNVNLTTPPTNTGSLTVVVTTSTISSGTPVQVGTVVAAPASPSSGSSDPEPEQQPVQVVDTTPTDPAPAGTNIQTTDNDGDGLREEVTAADGNSIDGNRDGIPDATQSQVAGLRLINDGAAGSDYGALSVSDGIQLEAVTLTSADTNGDFSVSGSSGGTVVTTTPSGITNALAGVVSFTVSGVTPGGTTEATLSLPTGLASGSGNAYLRFNYSTNRFEEYVDADGKPLYTFVDSNGDGNVDGVKLSLVDGDPSWDGDGEANGTVVDPGFYGNGDRTFTGTKGGDTLTGNVLVNTISGNNGNDTLSGDLGNDILLGGNGRDLLTGGEGSDQLSGGRGKDRFIYTSIADSRASTVTRETISDFRDGDKIDLSAIDANATIDGNQAFAFIKKQAFTGVSGQLRFSNGLLEADINGDRETDFAIALTGRNRLYASSFVL